jgi:protein phosphatase
VDANIQFWRRRNDMQRLKKTKIRHVTVPTNKRLIFVSDIHADLDTFKAGLDKINFSSDDYLFIIGDIYEKGSLGENLKIIRYIMELSKLDNVFVQTGNCDEVLRMCYPPVEDKEKFLYFIIQKQKSILNDMAHELNIDVNEDMDIDNFMHKCIDKYKDIFEFVNGLDDVIFVNDLLVLVHAGIADINNIDVHAMNVLKYDRFYEASDVQPKLMVVGHYPTRNYRPTLASANPIFDFNKRIISIDGGNHVVKGGQINFVILNSIDTMEFNYTYTDHYPKHIMKYNVKYNTPKIQTNITFGQNEVHILDSDLDFYYVNHLKTNTKMWIYKNNVYYNNIDNKYYAYDGTNQFLSVDINDEISICIKANPYSLIKKDGIIGLIETKYLDNDI